MGDDVGDQESRDDEKNENSINPVNTKTAPEPATPGVVKGDIGIGMDA
jgi:hypothetical protein